MIQPMIQPIKKGVPNQFKAVRCTVSKTHLSEQLAKLGEDLYGAPDDHSPYGEILSVYPDDSVRYAYIALKRWSTNFRAYRQNHLIQRPKR